MDCQWFMTIWRTFFASAHCCVSAIGSFSSPFMRCTRSSYAACSFFTVRGTICSQSFWTASWTVSSAVHNEGSWL